MTDINIAYFGLLIATVVFRFILMPGSVKDILPSLKEGNLNFLGTLVIGVIAGYGILVALANGGTDLAVFTVGSAFVAFLAIYGSPTLFDRVLTLNADRNNSQEEQPNLKEPEQ